MMDKVTRIREISKSRETGEYKKIKYKEPLPLLLAVKEIPLNALLYNPLNGRIKSSVLSYQSSVNKELDPELEYDKEVIERLLYRSANRNDKTKESLEEKGQQEVGVVTKDGFIIDGNRRAMLLNLINGENKSNIPFKAIVLPDEFQANQKELVLLETSYQMGVDPKIDYNPIEKYLRCKELKNLYSLTVDEIAETMSEKPAKIEDWLDILSLMDIYLESLNTPKVYTRLEKKEGHFVDLNSYLKAYKNKKNYAVKWEYTGIDVENLKLAYFDYIRLGIPVQRARILGKPALSNSFFCQKQIWDDFISEHKSITDKYVDEDFEKIKRTDPSKSNEDIFIYLDTVWKNKLGEQLEMNLSFFESELKDLIELHTPLKMLKRIVNNVGQIDNDKLLESGEKEIPKLLALIQSKIESMINLISKK